MRPQLGLKAYAMLTDPAVPFSIEQLEALMTWSEGGPLGVSIASDHEELPEVAEFWRQDLTWPAYSAFMRASGAVEATEHDTVDRAGTFTIAADMPAAIAWIEARERDALERGAHLLPA